jgi:hypothetical protein
MLPTLTIIDASRSAADECELERFDESHGEEGLEREAEVVDVDAVVEGELQGRGDWKSDTPSPTLPSKQCSGDSSSSKSSDSSYSYLLAPVHAGVWMMRVQYTLPVSAFVYAWKKAFGTW